MTVLVFGSINMDLFVELTALPHPGETVLTPSYRTAPGGKGANQAVAASRAGARVRLFGMVGSDGFGAELLSGLAREGVDCTGVGKAAAPTGVAFIAVDGQGENMIFGASGANLEARAEQVPDYLLGRDLIVILQMEVTPAENAALARRARSRGARILFNHAPALALPDGLLAQTDILVLNEHEAASLAGHLGWSERGSQEVAKRLVETAGLIAIVTLGEAGAVVASPEGTGTSPMRSGAPQSQARSPARSPGRKPACRAARRSNAACRS